MTRLTARYRRLRRDGGDDGVALVFVLLVVIVVTMFTALVSTSTIAQIRPAKVSQDVATATAAAEAGLGDFMAQANNRCRVPVQCAWLDDHATLASATPVTSGSSTTFSWSIRNHDTYVNDGFVRVVSTGRTAGPKSQARTLVADYTPSVRCIICTYQYVTDFETIGSALISARFPARTIHIDNAASSAAIGQSGTNLNATWAAPMMPSGASIPAGSPAVCDRYWYDDPTLGDGRNRFGKGNFQSDWNQSGSIGASSYTNYGHCEVTFGRGSHLDGEVHSNDAMLLSNTLPDGHGGPYFGAAVKSYWGGRTDSSTPLPPLSGDWRSQAAVGGRPADGSPHAPESTATQLILPTTLGTLPSPNICTYTGPTRVRLTGDGYATVTSPLTSANNSSVCTTNTNGSLSDGTGGVTSARVKLDSVDAFGNRTGYVITARNGTSSTPANIFDLRSTAGIDSTPAGSDTAVDTATAQWTDAATPGCGSATIKQQKRFDCQLTAQTKSFASMNTDIDAALSSDPAANVATIIQTYLTAASKSTYPVGAYHDVYYFIDSTTGPATTTATTMFSTKTLSPFADPLLSGSNGSQTITRTTATTTTTYVVKGKQCDVLTGCLLAASWGDGSLGANTPAFTVAVARSQVSYSSSVSAATATFPDASDVTQYSRKNGDIYVEGSLSGNLSLAAEGDVIVTGSTSYADAAKDAMVYAGQNNVRVYHPVKCTDTNAASIAATTVGFCPNDITGLYPITSVPSWAVHPAQQYADVRSDLTNISIVGAVFALNGSFYTDNYDRGNDALGAVSLTGSSWQRHRGALGTQWEIAPTGTTRHKSGFDITYHKDATLGSRVLPWAPTPSGTVADHTWSLQSVSTSNTLAAS